MRAQIFSLLVLAALFPSSLLAEQTAIASPPTPELSTKSIFAGLMLLIGGGLILLDWNRRRQRTGG